MKKLLLLVLSLAGCAAVSDKPHDCPSTVPDALRKIELVEIADRLVAEVCAAGASDEVVLVPDLLDLKTFQPGQTGMLLGEVVRGRLSARCKYKIRQVELSKNLRLNEGGLSVLTREVKELQSSEFAARRAFVGTYTAMPGKIVVTLRDLDLRSGTIDRIASREVTFGCRSGVFDQGEFYSTVR